MIEFSHAGLTQVYRINSMFWGGKKKNKSGEAIAYILYIKKSSDDKLIVGIYQKQVNFIPDDLPVTEPVLWIPDSTPIHTGWL